MKEVQYAHYNKTRKLIEVYLGIGSLVAGARAAARPASAPASWAAGSAT